METQTVEINGLKYEVNMESAKRIQEFRIGSRVKVLIKDYSGYKTHAGVIVGVDMFRNLPTVAVAYVPVQKWTEANVEFVYLNAETKDTEIVPMMEDDLIPTTETILNQFASAIKVKQGEIDTLMQKREFFLRKFNAAVSAVLEAEAAK